MRIEIPSQSSLTDEPFALRVTSLEPGARVVVYATAAGTDATRWESRASFEPNGDGIVDVACQEPLSGTYREVHGDGLLWSMAPSDGTPGLARFRPPWDSFEVGVTVRLDGHESIHTTIERRIAASGVTCCEVRQDGIVGTLFEAVGPGPHPAVALFHGCSGGVTGLEPAGALLASHGYTSFVVSYFGVNGLAATPCEVPLEALAAGVKWLRDRDDVNAGCVGALGTSVGAEAVLAMASWERELDLRAVVAVSPSSVVWQALGAGRAPARSRWTSAGRALHYVPLASERLLGQAIGNSLRRALGRGTKPVRMLAAYEGGLRKERAAAAAAIPVERIEVPLLLIAGRDDQVWPAAAMAERLMTRRRGCAWGELDRLVVLDDAGHMTLHVPGIPTTGRVGGRGLLAFGGSAAGDARATVNAWREILSFLDAHVCPGKRPAPPHERPGDVAAQSGEAPAADSPALP